MDRPFEPGERIVVTDNGSIVCGYEGTIVSIARYPNGPSFYRVSIESDYYTGEFFFFPGEIERVYA